MSPRNRGVCAKLALLGLAAVVVLPSGCGSDAAVSEEAVSAGFLPKSDGPSQFSVVGTMPEVGQYVALGEVTLVDNQAEETTGGSGVAMLGTLNGDHIVANVDVVIHKGGQSDFTFHWKDSVTFADGRQFDSTGRFVTFRPKGLIVSRAKLIDNPCCVPMIYACCNVSKSARTAAKEIGSSDVSAPPCRG